MIATTFYVLVSCAVGFPVGIFLGVWFAFGDTFISMRHRKAKRDKVITAARFEKWFHHTNRDWQFVGFKERTRAAYMAGWERRTE